MPKAAQKRRHWADILAVVDQQRNTGCARFRSLAHRQSNRRSVGLRLGNNVLDQRGPAEFGIPFRAAETAPFASTGNHGEEGWGHCTLP